MEIGLPLNRYHMFRNQWVPTTFIRSSVHLVGALGPRVAVLGSHLATPELSDPIISVSNGPRPLSLKFGNSSSYVCHLGSFANLFISDSMTQRDSEHSTLHCPLSDFGGKVPKCSPRTRCFFMFGFQKTY